MKSVFIALAALLAVAFLATPSMGLSERFFDDCASTTERITNGRRYVGGSVFQLKKLGAGNGTLQCLNYCDSYQECWSWNYLKSKKLCFLMSTTDSEMTAQRAGQWVSGYRECNVFDGDWNNQGTDMTNVNNKLP